MSLLARLKRQSTMTALAACLFLGGVTLLFIVLYHESLRAGPLSWITGACFIGAVACWAASARAGERVIEVQPQADASPDSQKPLV